MSSIQLVKLNKSLKWFGKKISVFLLIFSLFIQTLFNLASPVYAATSPWSQTDWSGGSGQTNWSDATKYSTGSNVTTSTSNHVTSANTEKLSNTNFDTNLTDWNTAASTLTSNVAGYWNMDQSSWNGTSGEVTDSSGNSNNGTSINAHSGTSTGSNTSTTLNNTNNFVSTNALTGATITITGGLGSGQIRTIASNTNTQITVSVAWDTTPDNTSTYNITSSQPTTVPGKILNAGSFNQQSQGVQIPNSASLNVQTGDFTVAAWVYPKTSNQTGEIVGKDTGGPNGSWYLYWNSNQPAFRLVGTTSVNFQPGGSTSLNAWHYVMAVVSSGTISLYVDNALIGSTSAPSSPITTTGQVGIGYGQCCSGGRQYLNGDVDEAAIWSRALTTAERSALYNSGTGSAYPFYTTTRDTTTTYSGSAGSAKIVTGDISNFTQSVNVGDTSTYNLVAYAYTNGTAVTSSDAELYYNGSTVSTTYTSVGSGWYKLTGTVTGANASRAYGVQVKASKTIYLDNLSVNNYSTSGTLTSSIFDSGSSVSWGTLTYSATTPTNTSAAVKVRTSNNSDMSGATDFSSCTAISSGSDISNNSCVSDSNQYAQYQLNLATTDQTITPDFTSFSLSFATITPSPTPNSNSSSSSNNSSPSAPSCNNSTPGLTPISLYGALPQDGNTIMLNWTDAAAPYDHYVLEYGLQPGNYIYGSNDIGGVGNRSYQVGSLAPNTTYYFRIRAGNGCAPGAWSNEISATTKSLFSSNQLVFTSSQLTPSIETQSTTPKENNDNSCEEHTVESGDTLWGIATQSLGNGSRYQEIIDSNTDQYPSLLDSNNLSTGWVLKISCDQEQPEKQIEAENTDNKTDAVTPQGGYELNVKVTDDNKKPVEGATVTIHSVVQTTTTNKDGIAEFKNVESGQHRVLIAYDNFEGEQSINLTGDVKKFDLTVTVQPKNVLLSPLVLAIIGILSLIIIVLAIVVIRARRRIKGLDLKQQTN